MMQPEQPAINTPSADVTSDVGAAPVDSGAPEQEASESRSWWDRLLGRRPRDEPQEPPPGAADRTDAAGQASKSLTITEEELQRRIQSEADKREYRRQQDARAQQKRELREKDPWAYAQQERQDEEAQNATGQLGQFVISVGAEHDRVSIDPLINSLPQAERERIMKLEGAGVGLPGRQLVVGEALKALEKHWKAEGEKAAEARLRRNPAFRKQVLSEVRGTTQEPELLPASGPSASDQTVSGILRRYYDLPGPS